MAVSPEREREAKEKKEREEREKKAKRQREIDERIAEVRRKQEEEEQGRTAKDFREMKERAKKATPYKPHGTFGQTVRARIIGGLRSGLDAGYKELTRTPTKKEVISRKKTASFLFGSSSRPQFGTGLLDLGYGERKGQRKRRPTKRKDWWL